MKIFQFQYAILSGFFGASAGVFGKLFSLEIFQHYLIIRILLFGAMLICNAAVWTMFVKALHQSGSTIIATIISSTVNYLFTALFGVFLLGEVITIYWWIGILIILSGLILILSENVTNNKDPKKDN